MSFDKRAYQREYMAKKRAGEVHASDMAKCPDGVELREWTYACERAGRAKKYATMFPNHVKPSDLRFQDPLWQWENEVRGRFGGIVGGSLSGTRSHHF